MNGELLLGLWYTYGLLHNYPYAHHYIVNMLFSYFYFYHYYFSGAGAAGSGSGAAPSGFKGVSMISGVFAVTEFVCLRARESVVILDQQEQGLTSPFPQ